MSFMMRRVAAITKKEIYHILRDPFTLVLSLGLPVFLVFVFGFAIEFNVKNIHLAVFDADQTQSSRRLMDTFGSSGYFIVDQLSSIASTQTAILNDQARAAMIIPDHFEADLFSSRTADVQLLLDGSDNSTVVP